MDLDEQMTSLDDFVTRAKLQNSEHHGQHCESLQNLSETVEGSYSNIGAHFKGTFSRVQELESEMDSATDAAKDALEPLSENLCQPLAELREDISGTTLQEYNPTGDTPKKMAYEYPKDLPQTKEHAQLIAEFHGVQSPIQPTNPSGVFADADLSLSENQSPSRQESSDDQLFPLPDRNPLSMSLREIHPNVNPTTAPAYNPRASTTSSIQGYSIMSIGPGSLANGTEDADCEMPLFKKSRTSRSMGGKGSKKSIAAIEGRENVPPPMTVVGSGSAGRAGEIFAQSVSRRKSPRLN